MSKVPSVKLNNGNGMPILGFGVFQMSNEEAEEIVVENGPFTPPRTNFLLRQVVVPSWLQVVLLLTYAWVFIGLLIHSPLRLLVILGVAVAFGVVVRVPLQRYAGQPTNADYSAEVEAAPNRETAISIRWRQMRTYQVWQISLLIVGTVAVILGAMGVPLP